MNTYVDYQISSKLKDLGFDKPCSAFWDAYNGSTHLFLEPRKEYHWLIKIFTKKPDLKTYNQDRLEYEEGDNAVLAPTIAQVIMWLYEKYNIWIEICVSENIPYDTFYYRILKIGEYFTLSHNEIYTQTPSEAYLEAIEDFLNNMLNF